MEILLQKNQQLYQKYLNDYHGISSVVTDEILSYGGQSNDYCYRCEHKLNLNARPGESISIYPCGHIVHPSYCHEKVNPRKYDQHVLVVDWQCFSDWGSTFRPCPLPKSRNQCNVCYGPESGTSWSRQYCHQIPPFNSDNLFFTHKIKSFITKLFTEINRDLFESREPKRIRRMRRMRRMRR